MKLKYEDLIFKHENKPCVVACHGPSLDISKNQIENLQAQDKILRISMNEWYDFFKEKPDYWIVSNSEFTIGASISGNSLWAHRGYPQDVFNSYNIPLLYNATADLTDKEFIKKNLKCDYLFLYCFSRSFLLIS